MIYKRLKYKQAKTQLNVRMRSKQMFNGHIVIDTMSILMSFSTCFLLKLRCFYVCLCYFSHFRILISLSIFKFWYSIKYLGNINWEVLPSAKLGTLHLTQNFLL